MTAASERERFEDLYDVERHVMATDGGILFEDPYPAFAELLDAAPVHEGSVRELLGHPRGGLSLLRDGPTYTAMSYEANDTVLRENQVFSSTFYAGLTTLMFGKTILEMVGDEHRRYRALAQPAFTPKRAQWWIDQWITTLVDEAISAIEHDGRAELNTDLCARIPLQTITASFGLTREEAFAFREGAEGNPMRADNDPAAAAARQARTTEMLHRVIEERRRHPQDDVITMLVESELDEDGHRQLLTDDEIYGFARLILTAGSGTTWRQLGILLVGLLRKPELLDAVREDRELLRRAIDEAVRWEATDPIFRRLVTEDVNLCGVDIPAGAIVEMNLGAGNHDPSRWDHPEEFDPYRPPKPNVGFAGGPHVCLGMHVARAEMWVAMNAVLDRLPNLRIDPDAPTVRIIGLEHRGPNGIPVVFGENERLRNVAMTEYRLISSDSHVTMPDAAWPDYLSPEFRDRAPRVEQTDDGDVRVFEGKRTPIMTLDNLAGKKPEEFTLNVRKLEDRRSGAGDPVARIQDMDTDGVDAEVLYVGGPLQTADAALHLDSVRGYNRWLSDYASHAPDRLLGVAAIPIDTPERAAEEIAFAAAQPGLVSGYIPLFPPEGDYGDPKWDPMWRAFLHAGFPVGLHVGGRRPGTPVASIFESAPRFMTGLVMSKLTMAESVSELIHGLVMQRFPELQFVAVEGQIGWCSFFEYYSDHLWEKHRHWTKSELEEPPSHYFRRQVFATFMEDPVGLRERHHIGIDNIMWASDYPHSETTWPNSKALTDEWFTPLGEDDKRKVLWENAAKLYDLI